MAEGVGFELTELLHSLVFKTRALNHSANLPFKLKKKLDKYLVLIIWLQEPESNQRSLGYEPNEIPLLYPASTFI